MMKVNSLRFVDSENFMLLDKFWEPGGQVAIFLQFLRRRLLIRTVKRMLRKDEVYLRDLWRRLLSTIISFTQRSSRFLLEVKERLIRCSMLFLSRHQCKFWRNIVLILRLMKNKMLHKWVLIKIALAFSNNSWRSLLVLWKYKKINLRAWLEYEIDKIKQNTTLWHNLWNMKILQ